MIDLKRHYADSARRFLQTAIVIDDQAYFGPTVTTVVPSLQAPTGSALVSSEPSSDSTVAVTVEASVGDHQAGSLNAKVLTQAFMSKDMICGLYRPEPGESMVDHTAGAAKLADIVVVDWFLESGSSRSAKDIVIRLLGEDRAENGRLRLVAVYTSQPGRAAIAEELLQEIEAKETLKGLLRRDGPVLEGVDTRIVVLNKRGTPPSADLEEVTEESLPDRLISEFACLSQGLLASFALSAVAAVRKGAHHVLTLYSSDIDGAFIGHRVGIQHPDDAKAFALDMLVSELRNLIELENVPEAQLGAGIIDAWVDKKVAEGYKFRGDVAEVKAVDVRTFITGGSDAVKAALPRQHLHGDVEKPAPEQNRVSVGKISRIFYPDKESARGGVQKLARLTTFQREPGRTRIPNDWLPMLTLGTLIQEVAEGKADKDLAVLLCMQPRCDSVRLKESISFPMQKVSMGGNTFNIVIQDAQKHIKDAWVSLKPMDTTMIEFQPDHTRQGVLGLRDGERYLFNDASGRSWMWLGDLKEMKAQRWAIDLGSRILGIGLDDMELLRLAGDGKVKSNWAA
jgi:hypothetical protein